MKCKEDDIVFLQYRGGFFYDRVGPHMYEYDTDHTSDVPFILKLVYDDYTVFSSRKVKIR